MSKTNNKILTIVILSTIFGLSAGVVGQIFARTYLLGSEFNIPLFGEISYQGNDFGNSNLIISNPKKVVIEQNEKITETANSVKNSIVGIFEKSVSVKKEEGADKKEAFKFDAGNYYQKNREVGQGFIITSDGWIVSSFIPRELLVGNELNKLVSEKVFAKYVIMNSDEKVYEVDNVIFDKHSNLAFWHISVNDLPVRVFASEDDINNGQMVMAVNWEGSVWPTTILNKRQKADKLILSSDGCLKEIVLSQKSLDEFNNSFLFNLNGDLLSIINSKGEVESVDNFTSAITGLLKNKKISRASFGVNYIDLSKIIGIENDIGYGKGALIAKNELGIAIEKGSAAEEAKLLEGDIIVSVNGTELNKNNNLCNIIGRYQPGEDLLIEFVRDKEHKNVEIKLGEMKY